MKPCNLRNAFQLCKDYALETDNLSFVRIAELMNVSPHALYRWVSKASMPAAKIPAYERLCGIPLVSEYLAVSSNRIVIEIPAGKRSDATDINDLKWLFTEANAKLARFYRGEAEQEYTEEGLRLVLLHLADHRANPHKVEPSDLDPQDAGS